MDILFLCYHITIDVAFNIKLTLNWEGGEKVWTVPVSTMQNTGLVLRIREPGS
jgi:hypothetical protein